MTFSRFVHTNVCSYELVYYEKIVNIFVYQIQTLAGSEVSSTSSRTSVSIPIQNYKHLHTCNISTDFVCHPLWNSILIHFNITARVPPVSYWFISYSTYGVTYRLSLFSVIFARSLWFHFVHFSPKTFIMLEFLILFAVFHQPKCSHVHCIPVSTRGKLKILPHFKLFSCWISYFL